MPGHVEVTHQSGISRLFNSIIAAVCIAPLVLLVVAFIVGFNEKRAVCESRAIDAGAAKIKEVSTCDSFKDTDGKLVFLQCDVGKAEVDVSSMKLGPFMKEIGDAKKFQSTGLQVKVEMLQCKENVKTSEKKDQGGGGGKTTVNVYTYTREWSSSRIDSTTFNKDARNDPASGFQKECAAENPDFPIISSTAYADTAAFNAYKLTESYVKKIPLDKKAITQAPDDTWDDKDCEGHFHFCTNDKYSAKSVKGLGKLRVSFFKFDDANKQMTVLGENKDGVIDIWTAPNSWMCKEEPLGGLKTGKVSSEDFFKDLRATSQAVTWLLRLGGFCLAWLAFSMMLAPLGVVADCIPCIGPCLGDMMEAVACVVAICPACACTMLVAGVCWVFMRPMLGIPLMLGSVIIFGVMLFFRMQKSARTPQPLIGGVGY